MKNFFWFVKVLNIGSIKISSFLIFDNFMKTKDILPERAYHILNFPSFQNKTEKKTVQ